MKKIILITLSLILVFSVFALTSCNETTNTSKNDSDNNTSESESDTNTDETTREDEVNMIIFGYVVDEYNNPVIGASVIAGGNTTTSGDDGSYSLTVLRASSFDVEASKSDYFSSEIKDLNESKVKENANLLNMQISKKHYVKGTVVNGAAPQTDGSFGAASGASVYIVTDKKYSAPVNEDGSYELEFAASPFTDLAVLFFEYEGYANTYSFVSVEKSNKVDGATANMVVAPNTSFAGTVTSGGKPIKNAVIKILPKIDTSAASNPAAAKTIETIIYTDEKGKYSSSDKSFICYASEYTVILEVRDLFGTITNEKGEKIRQLTQTVAVTDSRDFTVDFSLN